MEKGSMDRTGMWVAESVKEMQRRCGNESETIVECPVCCEPLEDPVPACAQGHQMCVKCKQQLSNCPLCVARNYLTENLLPKFELIKISLSDSDDKVIEKTIENQMGVGTQTANTVQKNANVESPPPSISNDSNLTTAEENRLSLEGKGKFPCRIGGCTDELPYCRMITHIKYLHEESLIDVGIVQDNEYTNTWRILYQVNDVFDRAIHIYNMGIFFMKIVTSEEGDLYGYVQITNSRVNAKHFQYKLEVGNKNTFVRYEGKVLGSRATSQNNHKTDLYIHNSYVPHLLQRKKSFECVLKISLLPLSPVKPKPKNN